MVTLALIHLLVSASFTTATADEYSCKVQELPSDMIVKIAFHSEYSDAVSLSQGNKDIFQRCKPTLKTRIPEIYTGQTPTFMPTVKRCLMRDNLTCLHIVKEYFLARAEIEPHHLAQIPALAAQLGAVKIFQSFGYNDSHEQWFQWMTRAVSKCRLDFLDKVAGIVIAPPQPCRTQVDRNPLTFYSEQFLASNELETDEQLRQYKHRLRMNHGCFGSRHGMDHSWADSEMITEQLDRVPSIEKIARALQVHQSFQRKARLDKLKSEIKDILSEGVYVIDDVVADTLNTIKIWWTYGQSHQFNDGGAYDFVQWLLGEGAPISDLVLIRSYFAIPTQGTGHLSLDKYTRLLKLSIRYASGRSETSLINQFKLDMKSQPKAVLDILPIYKNVLDTNLFDASVLKTLVWSLSHRYHIPAVWYNSYFDAIMDYFVKSGLRWEHLNVIRLYIEHLPKDYPYLESMRHVLLMLTEHVQKRVDS